MIAPLNRKINRGIEGFSRRRATWAQASLRRRMLNHPPGTPGVEHCQGYLVRFNDAPNFYTLYKDIFIQEIYRFETQHRNPRILDCGSNIGMSVLYFKHLYPDARIVGFEPDPEILPYLTENLSTNQIDAVEIVDAALSGRNGSMAFNSDGKYGSYLSDEAPTNGESEWTRHQVSTVRLRDYLTDRVDFLKMNIEGAEWEVLTDTGEDLRKVREMVIEYHHLPGRPRTLHKILELLHSQGFEYLLNDFDADTNGGVVPPFRLDADSRYFLLIYAKQLT